MNYIKLRKEIEKHIDKQLDHELRSYEGEKATEIQKRFIQDHVDVISFDALQEVCTDEVDTMWSDYFGDDYDEHQIEFSEWLYLSIVKSDKFWQRVEDELSWL